VGQVGNLQPIANRLAAHLDQPVAQSESQCSGFAAMELLRVGGRGFLGAVTKA